MLREEVNRGRMKKKEIDSHKQEKSDENEQSNNVLEPTHSTISKPLLLLFSASHFVAYHTMRRK